MRGALVWAGVVAASVVLLGACWEPSDRPDVACARACDKRAGTQCTADECSRGCAFILDRLAEHEQDDVIACIAKGTSPGPATPGKKVCDDRAWADCAASIGVHADGGPPSPPPAQPYQD